MMSLSFRPARSNSSGAVAAADTMVQRTSRCAYPRRITGGCASVLAIRVLPYPKRPRAKSPILYSVRRLLKNRRSSTMQSAARFQYCPILRLAILHRQWTGCIAAPEREALEHFSVDLPEERARRQYGDRCGRSRSPSQSDGGVPAAIPNTRSREATQGKSLKNALGRTALTLSLLTSLTGCPLLLIGAAGAAGGGVLAAADRRTLPTQVEDRRIQSIA